MFKWAVEQELVDANIWHALQAVAGLRNGKTEARESKPVAEEHVTMTLAHLSPTVRAMVELQLITGMRPCEICGMRPCDIDTTGNLWVYRPSHHKTEHHGHERAIYLGPKAQAVLKPILKSDLQTHIFSPAEAERARRNKMHADRVECGTPLSCGNVPGSNRERRPRRPPGNRCDVAAYRRAITRACDRAFPPPAPLAKREGETAVEWKARLTSAQKQGLRRWRDQHHWHPHQLRHTAATRLRKEYGLEAA
ncbi:MAG: site-specific integrase [Planctomycetota bacterium]|nr:site-specific integrase [Planctomycetota bacterium]